MNRADGTPINAVFGFTNMLVKLIEDYHDDKIIVVFDAKGKNFRHQIYDDYKSNRPPMPDELREQLKPVKDICKAIGFPLLEISGVDPVSL